MLSLYSFCSVLLQLICSRINVGYIPKLPPLQNWLSLPCRCSCLVVFVMCGYCLSVDISVLCFQSYSVFNVQEVILDLVYYFNRTLYRQCFIVVCGRFFARMFCFSNFVRIQNNILGVLWFICTSLGKYRIIFLVSMDGSCVILHKYTLFMHIYAIL